MADNTRGVWRFLRGKGLTPAQAAGVVGVMQQESGQGLSTTATNPTSGAYGIAQWLGGRKSSLMAQGNPSSLSTQLNHLWSELQGPERGALQALKGAHTIEDATRAWLMKFERPGANEMVLDRRVSNARNVFNRLSGTPGDASAGGGGATTTRIPGQTITSTIPTVDKGAFEQARKIALVGGLIAKRNPNSFLLRSGLLSTQEPALSDFVGSKTVKDVIPGATVRTPATASASFSTPPAQSGVANFEGKKVAAWIAPALKYARAHGWKGQVNSGYRSFADQTRIYNSGVRPAAKPGTSNHEGTQFPRGAVDVSDAPTLAQILARSPYGKRLKWAGAKDPVHFSHPHGGSY